MIKSVTTPASLMLAMLIATCVAATAQTPKPDVTTVQLGAQLTKIPAPAGFEEAMSQFEKIQIHFNAIEDPGNDVLTVHLTRRDSDRLRAGEFGPFNFYTKVSIRKGNREVDYSGERFANLMAEFRKSGAKYLDINSPAIKAALERTGKSISEISKEETQVDMSQPVNLGEFDTRPNVYSVMLLLPFKTLTGEGEEAVPILGGLSFVRVRQRMIYVYTYRKYESKADVEVLRDFTKQWIGQILAAN